MLSISKIIPRIHFTTILFGIGLYFINPLTCFFYITLLLTVWLHELGHASLAHKCGLLTSKINIYPFGGLVGIEGITSRINKIIILLAGPMTNIILTITTGCYIFLVNENILILNMFFIANLINGTFNLLPIFPLDGGQICFHILNYITNEKNALATILSFTYVLLITILIFSIITFNITLIITVFIIYILGRQQAQYVKNNW